MSTRKVHKITETSDKGIWILFTLIIFIEILCSWPRFDCFLSGDTFYQIGELNKTSGNR